MGGWSEPRPGRFAPGKDAVPIVQEAGWDSGSDRMGVESLVPTTIRSLDSPARSESLYRLSCPSLPMIKRTWKYHPLVLLLHSHGCVPKAPVAYCFGWSLLISIWSSQLLYWCDTKWRVCSLGLHLFSPSSWLSALQPLNETTYRNIVFRLLVIS